MHSFLILLYVGISSLFKQEAQVSVLSACLWHLFFFWIHAKEFIPETCKEVLYLNNRSLVPVGRRLGSKQVIISILKKWSSLSPWSPGFQWLKDFKLCLLIQQIFHLFIIMGCWWCWVAIWPLFPVPGSRHLAELELGAL